MGREIVLFQSEERQSLQYVVDFLHQLADKLATNEVVLRKGTETLTVTIPNNLVLALKVEEEDKKGRTQRSLEIELEWYEGDDEDASLTLG